MSTKYTGASHIYVILYVKWIEIYILPHSARRKDLSYPKGMKDGPKSVCIFINQPANQPTDHLSYKIIKLENLSNHLSDLPQNFRYFYRRVSLRLVSWVGRSLEIGFVIIFFTGEAKT